MGAKVESNQAAPRKWRALPPAVSRKNYIRKV